MAVELPVLGTILIKCDTRAEKTLRDILRQALATKNRLCLLPDDQRHETEPPACHDIKLVQASYCFGPFDFQLIIRAPDAEKIEQLVIECVRADSRIRDTQTLVGIAIDAPANGAIAGDEPQTT